MDQRLRWVRHTLGRRTVDDPVLHDDDLSAGERDYLANPSGRRWLRTASVKSASSWRSAVRGLSPSTAPRWRPTKCSPARTAAPTSSLCCWSTASSASTTRAAGCPAIEPSELRREVADVLARFPGWAKTHRDGDGPERLAAAAVDLLVGFGLARREPDGTITARPAIARYRVGEPTITTATEGA